MFQKCQTIKAVKVVFYKHILFITLIYVLRVNRVESDGFAHHKLQVRGLTGLNGRTSLSCVR